MSITIRAARATDAEAIRTLVRSELLNPLWLDWPNFVVADRGGRVAGCVQLRPLASGAELASLVVRPGERGRGLGGRLIDAALARAPEPVLVITAAASVPQYRRRGFRPVRAADAPRRVRLTHAVAQLAMLVVLRRGRIPKRLVVLERVADALAAAA